MDSERQADRLRLSITRGRINLVDDSGGAQRMQIDIGPVGPDGVSMGVRDQTIRAGEYGHISVPPAGSDVVVLCVGGDFSNCVIIATNDQATRPTGFSPGDSGLYDNRGQRLTLTSAGMTVEVGADLPLTINAPGSVVVNSPNIQLGGAGGKKVALDGDPIVDGVIKASSTKVTAS